MLLLFLRLRHWNQRETRAYVVRPAFAASVLLLSLVGAAIAGCGGGSSTTTPPPPISGTPPGTYTLTVTLAASSNNITHTQQLTLIVQ